jgi:hypothetical protein
MPLAIRRARGGMMAAWRDLVPIALNAGVRDLPHAMTVLVETFMTQKAVYASQVWVQMYCTCPRVVSQYCSPSLLPCISASQESWLH